MQLKQRHKVLLWMITTSAAVFSLYLFNPVHFYFLNDDFLHIPLSKEGALFQRNSFRPVCDLFIRLDYFVFGTRAYGYHIVNLLLHVANTLLVYLLSKALLKRYGNEEYTKEKALMVAVVFFVYAFHSESIFWILGRSASLGCLFFIPAALFYLKRHEALLWFVLSMLFFVIGLFTYESVWIFPIIAALISLVDRTKHKVYAKTELLFNSVIVAVTALYFLLRYSTIGEIVGNYEASNFVQFDIARLATNFVGLITRCFTPPASTNTYFAVNLPILLAVALFVFVRWKRRREMFLPFILLFLLISVLPYLSLGINTHTVEGERFLYLPSVFAVMFLVESISIISKKASFVLVLFALLVGYHLVFLYASSGSFKTASTITRNTFKEINALKNKKRLFIENLPQSNSGALIFRLGFEEGLKWLKKPGTVDSIIVLSLMADNKSHSSNFSIRCVEQNEARVIDKILVPGPEAVGGYVETQIAPLTFNAQTDALFIYSDSTLQVIK